MSRIRFIGQRCITDHGFTAQVARALGLPTLYQSRGEADAAFLIRRLNQLKWCSRYWASARLELLETDLLDVAATQICSAAANYCQDQIAERQHQMQSAQEKR